MTVPPTFGVRRVTNFCGRTRFAASVGTCCIRPSRQKNLTWKIFWRKSRGHSLLFQTTSALCPTKSHRGFRADCSRSARTALAAATRADDCGDFLKWTQNPLSSARFTPWRKKILSGAKLLRRRSKTSALILKKSSRRLFDRLRALAKTESAGKFFGMAEIKKHERRSFFHKHSLSIASI